MILATLGSALSLDCRVLSAAMSAAVSWPLGRAAIIGTGSIFEVPNGLASMVARSTGALAGRNLVLSLWVTLDRLGSKAEAATAPIIHASNIDQRKRTLKRPSALKMASTFMAVSVVDQSASLSLGPAALTRP